MFQTISSLSHKGVFTGSKKMVKREETQDTEPLMNYDLPF
jgi:hypothetical protein